MGLGLVGRLLCRVGLDFGGVCGRGGRYFSALTGGGGGGGGGAGGGGGGARRVGLAHPACKRIYTY